MNDWQTDDQQLMKPFYHGWKREVVYRNTSEKEKPKLDVYYYTPDKKKLRSSIEINNYLKSQTSELTSSCFTFSKIKLNYEPFEIVRYAGKRKSRVSNDSQKPKICKTNKKSEIKRERVFQRKDSKSNETSFVMSSAAVPASSTAAAAVPEPFTAAVSFSSESVFLCSSSSTLASSRSSTAARVIAAKTFHQLHDDGIYTSVDKRVVMNKFLSNFNKSCIELKLLLKIFKYLTVKDLVSVSMTCKLWRKASLHQSLWDGVKLKGLSIRKWDEAADFLNRRSTRYINFDGLQISTNVSPMTYWSSVANAMEKLKFLKFVDLGLCSVDVLRVFTSRSSLEHIQGLTCSIKAIENNSHDSSSRNRQQSRKSCVELDMSWMLQSKSLKVLKINSNHTFQITSFENISSLQNLQALSLTTVAYLKENSLECLNCLSNLHFFEFGFCYGWQKWVLENLSHCISLQSLRLCSQSDSIQNENSADPSCLKHFFKSLKSLKHLGLINFPITTSIVDMLAELNNLNNLVVHVTADTEATKVTLNNQIVQKSKCLNFLDSFQWKIVTNTNRKEREVGNEKLFRQLSMNMPRTKIILD